MTVGGGVDPPGFSRDAYEAGTPGTIVRLSLVVAPHKAQEIKRKILILER